jgi:hypothetical protein
MENKGLLFIPDISGFTRFVSRTEIEHSRLIVQELLECLINVNHLGLEISEIEGDAILFFRFGSPPPLEDVYRQVKAMFCAFHKSLSSYAVRKYCQCKACLSAADLTLKIITHYGEFTDYKIKNFYKLIGKDVIVAHQLLKNDVRNDEYWLVTQNLLSSGNPKGFAEWMTWHDGHHPIESGTLRYYYAPLTPLRESIPPESNERPDITNYYRVASATRVYDAWIVRAFHATGDFSHRPEWMDGVKAVEYTEHLLPRIGMRCICRMKNGDAVTYTSRYLHFLADRVEFCETDNKGNMNWFTLRELNENRTEVTLDYYIPKRFPSTLWFRLTGKRTLERSLDRSMQKLGTVVREIRLLDDEPVSNTV